MTFVLSSSARIFLDERSLVTAVVSDLILRSRVQIQPGSKKFVGFFLFSFLKIFFPKASRPGKNGFFFAIVVLFHTTFVDTRTSVERRNKDGELRRCPKWSKKC